MRSMSRVAKLTLSLFCLVFLLGMTAIGCDTLDDGDAGDDGLADVTTTSGAEAPEPGDTTTTSVEPSPPSSTATTLASTEEVLPNGHIRSMGYIDDVWEDSDGRHLSIDYAEFVSGDEATEAARADGMIGPTEEWDLDFYIRNQNPRLREWDISDSVAITTATRWAPHDGFEAPCTWADFITFWGPGPLPDGDSHLHETVWWIERDGDTIVKIDEQYLP